MERTIAKHLNSWFEHGSRSPILVRGVRQCGKSYSVRAFLEQRFPDRHVVINLDFEEEFCLHVNRLGVKDAVDALLLKLAIPRKPAEPTALFIDEIQRCPVLIAAFRYFKEELPHLTVVGAGSYLEFALRKISLPVGRVANLFMNPMTFDEFLWATNHRHLSDILTEAASSLLQAEVKELPELVMKYQSKLQPFHQELLRQVYLYEVIGGFPESIKAYLELNSLRACREVLLDLKVTFLEDLNKYATDYASTSGMTPIHLAHMKNLFDNLLPLQKKVKYATINRTANSGQVREAIEFLKEIRLIYEIYSTSSMQSPLRAGRDSKDSKILICDTGLFNAFLNTNVPEVLNPDFDHAHGGDLSELLILTQSIQRQSPKHKDHEVFFWRKKTTSGAEIDGLFIKRNKLVPLEIKRKRSRSYKSLAAYLNRLQQQNNHETQCLPAIVSSMELSTIGSGDGIVNFPFYLAALL